MKKILLGAFAAVTAVTALSAAETLVKRQDLTISPVWKQRIFNGKELIPLFNAHTWSYGGKAWSFGWRSYGPDPKLPLYKDSATNRHGHKRIINGIKYGKNGFVEVKNPPMAGKKIKLEDFFLSTQRKGLLETHKNHTPVLLDIHESRPVFWQNEKYDLDMKDFAAWKKAHPNFIGFRVLAEFDSDVSRYMGFMNRIPDSPLKREVAKRFPVPKNQYDFVKLVDIAVKQQKKFHFGEERLWSLSSSGFLAHIMAQAGIKGFFYEATGQELGRWQIAGAFTRGASRQFDIPFAWYFANWYTGYTRDGKLTNGENRWWGKRGRNGVHMGVGRSLTNRQGYYSYLIGSCMIDHENWGWNHLAGSPGKGVPSFAAKDFNDLYVFSTKNTRGTPYTPIAILTPISHNYGSVGYNGTVSYGFKDYYSYNAFFFTLLPIYSQDARHRSLRKKGDQGCLFNSPFGEIYDVICPDARQDAKTIAKVLSAYKAAFLISQYRKQDLKVDALKEYVKNGGTLFISSNYLEEGILGADFAGVKAGKTTIPAGKYLIGLAGEKILLKNTYRWNVMTPIKAKVLLKDDKGNAVSYVNEYGKGRVITIACPRMLPWKLRNNKGRFYDELADVVSGRQTYELVKYLLTKVQEETFPVKVKGDIQYGLNKTKKGYILYFINNKGVVKFTYEPEVLQKEKAAKVIADISRLKGKKAYDMHTGKKVSIKNGKLALSVGPGAVRMIGIE